MRKIPNEELNRLNLMEFKSIPKNKIILVLDNIRSAQNVGSIFRTADAFAIMQICLIGITPAPTNREVLKSSLGAEQSIDWKYFGDIQSCLKHLTELKAMVVLVEQIEESEDLSNYKVTNEEIHAFVFGNEVNGISDEFLSATSHAVAISQFGTKHSINVAVCAAIVIWQLIGKGR